MTTLAKSKAQGLVQPAKPLAVTPNVRLFNNPAAGATLSLSTESTNLVQVVNPASTLTINVDGQNFSAFGANHFVLHVDTTAATEISLNFVRGATILAIKVIEIDADQIAVLTFAAITKANDAVTLLAIGHHVVGKSEATDGNGAVGGLLLVPTGADESTDGDYQRFAYDGASTMIGSPSYVAELDPSDWQPNPTIKFKLPSLTQAGQSVALYLFNGDVADLSGETFTVNNLIITADLNGDAGAYQLAVDHLSGRAVIDTTAIDPVPAAGTEITISIISRSSMLISFGSENIPVTLPTDFLATTLNIVLMSRASDTAVPPLSIQVTGVEVA